MRLANLDMSFSGDELQPRLTSSEGLAANDGLRVGLGVGIAPLSREVVLASSGISENVTPSSRDDTLFKLVRFDTSSTIEDSIRDLVNSEGSTAREDLRERPGVSETFKS